MEQNMQEDKNKGEVKAPKFDAEGEPINVSPKKSLSKKTIALILAFVALIILVCVYFLFLNKKDDVQPPKENGEIVKKEEVEVDKNLDSDGDNLPDYMEKVIGTNPNDSDTDGDGYTDYQEIKNGYDPLTDKKFTEEEWEAVKWKIKDKDEGFYKKELGILPIAAKKCEYPDKIGENTKQSVNDMPANSPSAPEGVLFGKLVSYSGWNMINLLAFDNIENAGKYYSNSVKEGFASCEINNIKGVCKFKNTDNGSGGINTEGDFCWTEDKTVKIIITLIQGGLNKNAIDLENRAKESLNSFVAQFKNCEVE